MSTTANPAFERPHAGLQIVAGARQVGKTTLLL